MADVEPDGNAPCSRQCGNCYGRGYVIYYRDLQLMEAVCERCAAKDRNDQYKKTKQITTALWTDAVLDRQQLHAKGSMKEKDFRVDITDGDEIMRTMQACDELIGEFRRRHWMGGLCRQVYEARSGLSGQAKDFKVLIMASAGRVLITIQDTKPKGKGKFGGAHITLITADGDVAAKLGVQGICATKEEAIGLLWHAVYKLPTMKVDRDVRVG